MTTTAASYAQSVTQRPLVRSQKQTLSEAGRGQLRAHPIVQPPVRQTDRECWVRPARGARSRLTFGRSGRTAPLSTHNRWHCTRPRRRPDARTIRLRCATRVPKIVPETSASTASMSPLSQPVGSTIRLVTLSDLASTVPSTTSRSIPSTSPRRWMPRPMRSVRAVSAEMVEPASGRRLLIARRQLTVDRSPSDRYSSANATKEGRVLWERPTQPLNYNPK